MTEQVPSGLEIPWKPPSGVRAPKAVYGPSGLSDYAVSPLGMPAALLQGEVRVAFLGRTSTDDQQDPRQSLIRQLGNSKNALPDAWVIVAHFYDVESGRMKLDARGKKTGYERFDIPIARDGGIADLLEEAEQADRRFDVVICESVSRVARRSFEGLSIERQLEQADVSLFAANEPITVSGSRAQRILQRRINQSVAEYEVLNTLEQSWGGLCTHVREGWNIGKPCYGYRAKTYRHPNPAKAAKGFTKSRLEPDGLRGETVTQIALWRYEGLGYPEIVDRLNADLMKYPPPQPPGMLRARGAWGKSTVADIIHNPKYTGYQVFNRRASRSAHGKVNAPEKWVWSVEPAHEPLIPKWMYDQMNAGRKIGRGRRNGLELNSHPEAKRTGLFRSLIFCSCGRRMFGAQRPRFAYYVCHPLNNNRGRADKYAGHRKTVYVREDAVAEAVAQFLTDRVFGQERVRLLLGEASSADKVAAEERLRKRASLERAIADVEKRQQSVLLQAQSGDPDDPFTRGLRATYNGLEAEKKAIFTQIEALDAEAASQPELPGPNEAALLDALPLLALKLAAAPPELLRRLFEVLRLEVRLLDDDHVEIAITLPAGDVPDVAEVAERITDQMTDTQAAQTSALACVDVVRAPGEIRTHTGRVLNPLPLPVGLRGRSAGNFTGPVLSSGDRVR